MASNIPIGTACRGEQICGKCLFKAEPSENISKESTAEKDCKARNNIPENFRLACYASLTGDILLSYPN